MSTISETLELWGGPECTIVRIGDQYRNEVDETGHLARIEDLDEIAEVGIRTLRYPVLWETTSPHDPEECDWRWSDKRLARLRELGMQSVAGLVHHGSGLRDTDLLDSGFPALLARHAERVARRYPWLEMFTPVNEPLTTARFSGLINSRSTAQVPNHGVHQFECGGDKKTRRLRGSGRRDKMSGKATAGGPGIAKS